MAKSLSDLSEVGFLRRWAERFLIGLWSFVKPWEIFYRQKRIQSLSQDVGVFRFTNMKPARVTNRSFSLFYRPRFWILAIQFVFLFILAVWTAKNYLDVLRSL